MTHAASNDALPVRERTPRLWRRLAGAWSSVTGIRPATRATALGAALWPRACLLCEQGCGANPLCAACCLALPGSDRPRCPICAAPAPVAPDRCQDCARLHPVLASTHAAADYCSPLAEAITALKFGRQLGLASGLGLLLARSLAQQWTSPADRVDTPVDCLVPIPLAAGRLADRGFNQAESIARALARHWPPAVSARPPPLRPDLLARPRETPRQSSLRGAERRDNVDAGFTARPASGLVIGLVDDVMTTGATLDAAARSLLDAGARLVRAFVVARTP